MKLHKKRSQKTRQPTKTQLRPELLESRRLLAAGVVDVQVENLAPTGGLTLTPAFVAFHDGSFQIARRVRGADQFSGLEALAEEGDVSGLASRFASTNPAGVDAVLGAPAGFAGAPVIEPGETATATITVTDSEVNRFFSYASMVVPSNDAFIANVNARSIAAFNSDGDFRGPITINVFGRDIYDAGTEVNDADGGAAFSTGGGDGVDESGRVRGHRGLDSFIGTGLPTGSNLQSAFDGRTPIARITISAAAGEPANVDNHGPITSGGGNTVTSTATFVDFDLSFSDPSGVNVSTIDVNDIVVVGRGGTRLNVTSVTTDAAAGSNPNLVTATYRLTKDANAAFTAADNGTYRVFLNRAEASDTIGKFAQRSEVGQFGVSIAQQIEVSIENLADTGGLTLTPLWIGFHDGSFDLGTNGQAAAGFGGLEELAEGGVTSGLESRFDAEASGVDAVLTAPGGFAGAPVIEPGETATSTINVGDPRLNQFFSYASMVIPSNDAFIANLNAEQFRVFDANGKFRSTTIYVFGRNVYDAGTEVNNPTGDAAFSTGGGTAVDENGVITRPTNLDTFVGTGTPTGNLGRAFTGQTPIAKITVTLPGDTPRGERGRPTALAATIPSITTAAATAEVVVEISDPSGVDVSQLQASDFFIRRRGADTLTVSNLTTDAPAGQSPRSVRVTFSVASPSGNDFSAADNGEYGILLRRSAVADGNGVINRNLELGLLTVNI